MLLLAPASPDAVCCPQAARPSLPIAVKNGKGKTDIGFLEQD
jgi:hypothetical protein